jgi:hypothetical protein
LDQVEVYKRHFSSAEVLERIKAEGLREDEAQWIQKERTLCALDFNYWSSRYAKIAAKGSRLIGFEPRAGQRIFLDICGEMEEKGVAIMVQALKARQLGISTVSELIVAHRVQFYSHTNAVIASSDPDKSKRMSQMIELCWENMPWWLMPCEDYKVKTNKDIKYQAGQLIEFPNIRSAVSIQWGNQTTGIARGTTPTVVHLSELADFEHPEELVEASLMPAFHDDPFHFMILESTANGVDNWWAKRWNRSKSWPRRSRFRPMFLPWYVDKDFYPNPTWLKAHPIPPDWEPNEKTQDHATRAIDNVQKDPILKAYLGQEWVMSREQKWFYEENKEDYAKGGILNKWFQEMPADDLEAFQHKSMSIFDAELLANKRDHARPPLMVLGLQGRPEDLPLRLQPSEPEIDRESPFKPRQVVCSWKPERAPDKFVLIPLKYEGVANTDPQGKIFIWELPQEGEEYAIGVDTGYGVQKDRTVVQVVRKATPFRDAEQVAEFASDSVNASEVWPWALVLGTMYSTYINGERRQAKMIVEAGSASANGDMTVQDLFKRGWSNQHMQLKQGVRGMVATNQTTPSWGWKTTEATRGPMLDFLVKALRDGWLQVNSPWFIYEMGELIRHEKKERLEASEGGHDDRLMALGIAFYSLHQSEIYRSANPVWQQRVAKAATDHIYPVYEGPSGFQATDEDWEASKWDPNQYIPPPSLPEEWETGALWEYS